MATLREYFDVDLNRCLSIQKNWQIKNQSGGILYSVTARISQDFHGNAKYWSFFIGSGVDVLPVINALFATNEVASCMLSHDGDGLCIEAGFSYYSDNSSSETLIFTKRILLYIDELLEEPLRSQIKNIGLKNGFYVIVRDKEYALKKSELEKPLAFISHDSRDKDVLVRGLAHEMSKLMCPVWYDEFSLNVGDSLRSSIESGLKETQKCVVILSPNFLNNNGWGKAEFDSVFTREILEKENVFLPVWHNLTVNEVYDYSPRLADKVSLNSELGIEELSRKLVRVIKNGNN
ncbi:MAG: toll/interleukin-1 receptor domain-containing protein [Sneathiella sp.]